MGGKIKDFLGTWFVVLLLNQLVFFGACFNLYCILSALPHTALITFVLLFFLKDDEKESTPDSEIDDDSIQGVKPANKTSQNPLKAKGDAYEKYIGRKLEDKGELVIYNGFIKGYEDKGVDIISVCHKTDTINLIQCKNWTQKSMLLNDVREVYAKLSKYDFDFFTLSPTEINSYLEIKNDYDEIEKILKNAKQNLNQFNIRKTLYVSSDKVMDLNIGRYLTMTKPNIFKYEDMKIVVRKINR